MTDHCGVTAIRRLTESFKQTAGASSRGADRDPDCGISYVLVWFGSDSSFTRQANTIIPTPMLNTVVDWYPSK